MTSVRCRGCLGVVSSSTINASFAFKSVLKFFDKKNIFKLIIDLWYLLHALGKWRYRYMYM